MKKRYRIILTLPAILITFGIFVLSNQPKPLFIINFFEWSDKVLHLIAYFIYGVSLIVGITGNFPEMKIKKIMLIVILIGALYGFSDEIHQYFVPGRDADFFDWLADFIGITTALSLIKPIRNVIERVILRNDK